MVVSVESEGKVQRDDHVGDAWLPDVPVRDDDRSLMARWGVRGLPAAYLFTWRGGMRPQAAEVGKGASQRVARKLETFYQWRSLKILVDAPIDGRDRKLKGAEAKGLRLAVQSVLLGQSRFDVVADDRALDRNIQLMIKQARATPWVDDSLVRRLAPRPLAWHRARRGAGDAGRWDLF